MTRRALQLTLQLLTDKTQTLAEGMADAGTGIAYSQYRGLRHLPQARLDLIVQQVRRDGFHVEHLVSLTEGAKADDIDTMEALGRWCQTRDLRISINHERGICFFESRHAYPSGASPA
jgi:hypothetical protein